MEAGLCPQPRWRCEQECALPLLGDGGDDGEVLSEKYALAPLYSLAAGFAFAGEGVDDTHPCPSRREGFRYGKDGRSSGVSSGFYSGGVSALFFVAVH